MTCIHIPVRTAFFCERCGEPEDKCVVCNEIVHICPPKQKVKRGYRIIPHYPDYIVSRQGNVRHIVTDRPCTLERITKSGHALVLVSKDGRQHVESAQNLRAAAFPGEEIDE